MERISEYDLDKELMSVYAGGQVDNDVVRLALQELKQRRESALRPAAKFLNQDFGQLIGKVCSECDEVIEAWDDDFDQCPEQLPKEAYNDILMELVDVQMACETALTKILPDRADRDEVRRQVIEKNAKRGYYEGVE